MRRKSLLGGQAWDDLFSMLHRMERLTGGQRQTGYPATNIWSNDDHVVITMEVPGVDPETINVEVQENRIEISGEAPAVESKEGETWWRNERIAGSFSRAFDLPFRIDPKSVKAEGRNGILAVRLEGADEDKPKKIKVKVA